MEVKILEREVLACLQAGYGLTGTLQRLAGENINYRLTTPQGERYVLKIVDEHMPSSVVEMEFELLDHVEKAGFSLKLPRIIRNKHRKTETRIKKHKNTNLRLRLIEFIDGDVWENIDDISDEMLSDMGQLLAEFDQALCGFDHPAAHRDHRWNLVTAGQHRGTLGRIGDPQQKALVGWAFDVWEQASGMLPELPHQVIHGDANRGNLLVDNGRIVGLVDFGDCCYNPRICELAICLAYFMMGPGDPMKAASLLLAGYTEVIGLTEQELDVLFPLVCGRLAVSVCMAVERQGIDPDNANWFQSLAPSLELLGELHAIGVGGTPG